MFLLIAEIITTIKIVSREDYGCLAVYLVWTLMKF